MKRVMVVLSDTQPTSKKQSDISFNLETHQFYID
jgi:hypothetical protein